MECKEERRQFILRNYLIEKGFVQKCDFKSDAYDRHLEQKEERLNEALGHEQAQINILENDIANEVGNREMAFEEPFFERIERNINKEKKQLINKEINIDFFKDEFSKKLKDDVDGKLIEVEDKQQEKEENFKEIIEINRELNKE